MASSPAEMAEARLNVAADAPIAGDVGDVDGVLDDAEAEKVTNDCDYLIDAIKRLSTAEATGKGTQEAFMDALDGITRLMGHISDPPSAETEQEELVWLPPAQPGGPPQWGYVPGPGMAPEVVNPPPGHWTLLPTRPDPEWVYTFWNRMQGVGAPAALRKA